MEYLYNIGINENEIINMITQCKDISYLNPNQIKDMINVLKEINCDERQIKHILITNPFYLTKIKEDIITLINKLNEYGFSCLNILFDSNPLILNKEAFEITDYVEKQLKLGNKLNNIVDLLDSNPYLFEEI